ncbi:MAG TPA: hypothetical protein DCZ48_07050, partial [Methylococcaceae bacterium]|nr:hypothetical protein [Methylococcaceae bacterium]
HAERRNDEKNQYIYQFSAIANCYIWLFRGDTSEPDPFFAFFGFAFCFFQIGRCELSDRMARAIKHPQAA